MSVGDLLEPMLRARRFDEHLLAHADRIQGHYHVSIGLEATAAALVAVRQPDDLVSTTYRNHAVLAALGSDLAVMFAEVLGRDLGPQRGRSGSAHLSDPDLGILHTSALVSGGVPLALGYALARRRLDEAGIVFCFLGDGAFGEGAVPESLNLARLWELPVVFVCENNAAPRGEQANAYQVAGALGDLVRAHRIEAAVADGRDAETVTEVLQGMADATRADHMPRFLDARCPPWEGNATFFPHDATGPTDLSRLDRSDDDEWGAHNDPVLIEARRAAGAGLAADQLLVLDRRVTAGVQRAWEQALAAPPPPADAATSDVVAP